MDTPEDMDFLKSIEATDPDFVREYLGGIKPEMSKSAATLTVRQCALLLGVCQNTVLNHIRADKLKAKFIDGQWFIQESDFDAYKSAVSISRGKDRRSIIKFSGPTQSQSKEIIKEDQKMNGDGHYQKATSRTVTDFLHNWHRNKSAGFSLPTICRDFNQVSETPTNESQMSGILSSLRTKGIVIRKGKGIYQVSPTIVGESHEDRPAEQTSNATVAPAGVLVVDADIEPARVYSKKTERMAVEAYIRNHSNPDKDFSFTISDVAAEYPHLDRTKLGKACINMCNNGKLVKGDSMGQYVRVAKKAPPVTPAVAITIRDTPTSKPNSVLDEINQIMASGMAPDLKEKLIKRLMQD